MKGHDYEWDNCPKNYENRGRNKEENNYISNSKEYDSSDELDYCIWSDIESMKHE